MDTTTKNKGVNSDPRVGSAVPVPYEIPTMLLI